MQFYNITELIILFDYAHYNYALWYVQMLYLIIAYHIKFVFFNECLRKRRRGSSNCLDIKPVDTWSYMLTGREEVSERQFRTRLVRPT